jgi:hypothetical protein
MKKNISIIILSKLIFMSSVIVLSGSLVRGESELAKNKGASSSAATASAPTKKVYDFVYGTDLPIFKGALIEIKSYDEASKTYTIASVTFPGEGDSQVTPEGLKKAISGLNIKSILKNPSRIVGSQFKLDQALSTLFDEEVAGRTRRK